MQLSAQQKDAVEYIGSPALVIAGAGSGKTRTLTAKIAYLVSNGYDPLRILAITFTNKAAGEMKSRLVQLTNMPAADFPWVRTYHSACFRILKRYGYLLGFTPPIQIFTEYQRNKLLKDIILKLNIDKKTLPSISAQISYAKNSGDPHAYFEQKSGFSPVRYSDIYALYEKELFEKNAVDFDNILFLTRNLLKDNDALRKEYQNFFQFILVDEYQDSNNLQEELTRLFLGHENLFCVGDDWQAIYGFRGSNVNHFLTFAKKYEGARIFRLEENYRSSDEIVQVANSLIDYNEQKMDKKCFSRKKGGIVELYDFFNDYEESRWVANKIMGFREQGIPLHKMVVLYRTKFCSLAFEKTFRAFNVPYRMMGSKGFFERKEVLDINCYLIAAAFPKDDAAFERIINTPKRGIGPGMLNKINAMREEEMSLQDAARKALSEKVFTPKVYNALSELIQLLDDIKEQPPEAAIQEILTRSNYPEYLKHYSKTDAEYTSREEHIEELAYSASQKQTIHEYLEEVSLVREDKEEDETDNTIGIGLSTVHASKGLEYQVVFIVGCEENLFPHWRSLESQAELQEERRLMYVAVTRSEQFLFISSTNFRRGQPALRSRFLDEIE
ncbi:MAG: UvrD-helicase domain-containing protein, partial [Desulfobacterales bacterium]|nr:UvrD-helicase domain-containing protein [Desulfobacterales bacterium]